MIIRTSFRLAVVFGITAALPLAAGDSKLIANTSVGASSATTAEIKARLPSNETFFK